MSQHAANRADVIIVGAGIMGSASAFFLRRRGLSVLLLERDQVGRFASGTNFGNVRRQGRYLSQVALATRSRGIWGRLPELIGDDLEFIPGGHLRVVYDPARIAMLHEYARAPETAALDLQVLEGAALHEKFPYLGPEVVAGSYAPHDGHANPRLAAPAFARAAVREGVDLQEGVEITQVTKPGGDFLVQAADGRRYQAPRLLITAGAWGSRLSSQFGEPVPIETHGPQMGVTEPLPYVFRETVGVSSPLVSETIYFRQIPRGNVIFGGCFRTRPDLDTRLARAEPHGLLNQLAQLRRLAPALGRINVIRTWSGVEGYIVDDLPIMGPSSQVDGLYYAFGFCGAGFQLGPGVGDTMAELIATGRTETPLAAFDIGRFAQPRSESLAG
ncbi:MULTISPECIES: NAD(P)/FAD-dependent oxidoreductase [unclassified Pseudomonas]|uniref:NAD(P)/FAD-dependent oxidoreductase n=1 Tax=unclassified Pseudomonas TaxID=196821 RepID=UPI00235F2288|nr:MULTISPECIES: FAD-binding oxidoreductase [unclassified Pseudomonas]MDR6178245.1 sarcosine oxidase subunit beta [Pseudomonas sp. SORGH_AS_0211]